MKAIFLVAGLTCLLSAPLAAQTSTTAPAADPGWRMVEGQPIESRPPEKVDAGLAFYQGDLFPRWKHSVFAGGLPGMLLDRLEISHDKVVAEEPLLTELHSRIRDVRIGPDGALYVLTDSGGRRSARIRHRMRNC